nr:ATP-binding protein [Pyrococcus horikoshii]
MSSGRRRPSEIASEVGLEGRKIYPYLETLIRLGFVERELPIARKEKRGLYRISDPMLMSWFSLIYPNRTEIELGTITLERVEKILQRIFSFRFEDVSREFLVEMNKAGKLPFRFTKIGRWWYKGEEIDLVALNEDEEKALFIEVKWKDLKEREVKGILKDLEKKAGLVGLDGWDKNYGLIEKSIERKEKLREENYLVWDLKDFDALKILSQ